MLWKWKWRYESKEPRRGKICMPLCLPSCWGLNGKKQRFVKDSEDTTCLTINMADRLYMEGKNIFSFATLNFMY
jgi:hypothetical protein